MAIKIKRTDSMDPDFKRLVNLLDKELAERDGNEHDFYSRYNKLDMLRHVVVLYDEIIPLSCGAIKQFENDAMEVKRMYTLEEYRGQGLAGQVLRELENWAQELGYKRCVLETGKRQPEAINLYKKAGYIVIPNYGQYAGIENSVCFEKLLT